jgi:endonuclease/exonuclease/phosphatase family metal-dependent hydrolase
LLAGGSERTIVLGDFNQRVPRKYQPKAAFDALQEAILERLQIASDGLLEPIQRQAIDHVCHSTDLVCRSVASISNARPGEGQVSEHFGVRLELVLS